VRLRIEKAIYGGAGLARVDGKAIFVPFTLPGEMVDARITNDRGSYAEAELTEILEESHERTNPPCVYFGECGGCHYQHATYAQQLEMKRQILSESLERAHIETLPEIKVLSGDPLHYRNRVRFHIDRSTSAFCYKRRSSHANLPVNSCPIAATVLESTLRLLQENGRQWDLGKSFDEIEFFTNADETQILLSLWTGSNPKLAKSALEKLWPALTNLIPYISGAALFTAEDRGRQNRLIAALGDQTLNYNAAGRSYRVSMGSFFQVNRHLIDPLAQLVTSEAGGGLAYDLYAGVGLFAGALQSRFDRIVGVESAPSSVNDLRHNMSGSAHRTVDSSTLDFLRRSTATGKERPDFIIVDPPRAGLGKEVTGLLGQLQAPHITYVSCDPATLSRDLKSLLDAGYFLKHLHMVDMFPQTFHIESVAQLALR
jgi:23S rRNA (uracil1939-C5)-methyltransferase